MCLNHRTCLNCLNLHTLTGTDDHECATGKRGWQHCQNNDGGPSEHRDRKLDILLRYVCNHILAAILYYILLDICSRDVLCTLNIVDICRREPSS